MTTHTLRASNTSTSSHFKFSFANPTSAYAEVNKVHGPRTAQPEGKKNAAKPCPINTSKSPVSSSSSRASAADVDHLQEESGETEETGGSGTGKLVGGTLEGGSGRGGLGCDDGADSGGTGRCDRWSRGSGLGGLRGRGDGGGEGHDAGRGERTLGCGDGLAWCGSIGADGRRLGNSDGLAGRSRGVGDDA